LIYFDLFDKLLKLHKPNSGEKNEDLIRSISGNGNIPVVHQFYKLKNSQLKAKKMERILVTAFLVLFSVAFVLND